MMSINSANAPSLDLPARFMALSIVALAVSTVSAPWTLPLLQGSFSSFSLLAFVHLNTLGFIGAMIMGASYQLVPVAIQVPLASVRAGRLSFWFYGSGLLLFLSGLAGSWLPLLAAGATLLGIAFALYIGVILATWWRTPHRDVVSWHIALAAVNAGAGMIFGVLLAFNKSNGMLGGHLLGLLAAHITIMLGGWVMLTFFGVAYRLIGMFTFSEQHFLPRLAWAEFALVAAGSWVLALRFALSLPAVFGQIAAAMLLAGGVCFAVQIVRLYRRRMRRAFDIHMPFALLAAALAIATGALLLTGLTRGADASSALWVAVVWLALFGVAGTAIQGFFYKIATFLVWLKRYAPRAGTEPVPRLDELYSRRLAVAGWALWTAAVLAITVALLGEIHVLGIAALLLLAGAACFIANVVSIGRHWSNDRGQSHDDREIRRPTTSGKLVLRPSTAPVTKFQSPSPSQP